MVKTFKELTMTNINTDINQPITKDELLEKLREIVWELNTDIYTYEYLFTNQNIVESMNKCAPAFFDHYQELLTEKICLAMASLFDRAYFGSNENISFQLFVERLDHSDLKCTLNQKVSAVSQKIEVIRTLRNKSIAHNDAKFSLRITDTYKGISLELLIETVNEIKSLLQECHGESSLKITTDIYPSRQLENLLIKSQPKFL